MQIGEIEKFQALMHGVGEYHGRVISDALMDIYWEGLKEFDYETVKRAVTLQMRSPENGQYFPKIGDLTKHITGNSEDRGLTAWAKVDRAVRLIGPHRSVVFDDPIIHAVIADMGGWIGFGSIQNDEWPFKQNEFVKRYRGFVNTGNVGSYPSKLLGISDMHNRETGHETDRETVLLGDQSKALEVMRLGGGVTSKYAPVLLTEAIEKPKLKLVEGGK